jgi:hypothetical protein
MPTASAASTGRLCDRARDISPVAISTVRVQGAADRRRRGVRRPVTRTRLGALAATAPRPGSAAGATGTSIVAYVLSRSVGLPQIGDDIGNWLDPLGIAALSAEALTAVPALWTLGARMTPANRSLVVQRPG